MPIDRIESRAIADSRGRPTVETTLVSGAHTATASVPSGKSTGAHEAKELRDADGGVASAVAHVTGEIATALCGREFSSPQDIDTLLTELDGTPDKSRLGANAILSVSIAAQRLFALAAGVPLWKAIADRAETTPAAPRLYVNVMNGGAHADFRLPFQEYLLVVEGPTSAALSAAQTAFAKLGDELRGLTSELPMGDEGGYAPSFDTLEKPFELLAALASKHAGMSIAIDAAANELFHDGSYRLLDASYTPAELARTYDELVGRFSLHSIEDPFAETAGSDFAALVATLGGRALIVGDDLTVTNPARVADAIAHQEITALLVKPNQIGTVGEAIAAVQKTYAAGLVAICSHRSGETMDTFIADFAYGVGAHGIKAGGFAQRERLVKYERLAAIEQEAKAL